MPIEMKYLLYTVALAALQVALAGAGNVLGAGLPAAAGNRANMPEPAGWAGRAGRAHRNLLESLVLFVALVVVGQATGKFNAMTALASEIFFWGRVAYAPIYILGIPWLRTLVWGVSIAGLVVFFAQLI
jgi:uncharacterized MAPEG superfamily protein